jgi:hypothetical protein
MRWRAALVVLALLSVTTTQKAQSRSVRVSGTAQTVMLASDDIARMPHQTITVATRGQSMQFDGVPLIDLLKRVGAPSGEAIRGAELSKYVVVTGADGYRALFALPELDPAFVDRAVILADHRDGAALPPDAEPYQVIVPGDKRPSRWVRHVVTVEVFDAPRQ